jgi:hypothetical protein
MGVKEPVGPCGFRLAFVNGAGANDLIALGA